MSNNRIPTMHQYLGAHFNARRYMVIAYFLSNFFVRLSFVKYEYLKTSHVDDLLTDSLSGREIAIGDRFKTKKKENIGRQAIEMIFDHSLFLGDSQLGIHDGRMLSHDDVYIRQK